MSYLCPCCDTFCSVFSVLAMALLMYNVIQIYKYSHRYIHYKNIPTHTTLSYVSRHTTYIPIFLAIICIILTLFLSHSHTYILYTKLEQYFVSMEVRHNSTTHWILFSPQNSVMENIYYFLHKFEVWGARFCPFFQTGLYNIPNDEVHF